MVAQCCRSPTTALGGVFGEPSVGEQPGGGVGPSRPTAGSGVGGVGRVGKDEAKTSEAQEPLKSGVIGPKGGGAGTKLLNRERVSYSWAQTRAGRSKAKVQRAIPKSGVSGSSQPAGLTAVRSELQEPGFKFPGLRSPLVTAGPVSPALPAPETPNPRSGKRGPLEERGCRVGGGRRH